MEFHENLFSGSRVVACALTDRQTEKTMLIVDTAYSRFLQIYQSA
jgi:hypothetical protein